MVRQINSGSLPFALTVDSYSTISPSLGENSLSAMVLAGVIAFALIMVLMTALYRLPGFLACIALAVRWRLRWPSSPAISRCLRASP